MTGPLCTAGAKLGLYLTASLLLGALPQLTYGQETTKWPFAEVLKAKRGATTVASWKVSSHLRSVIAEIEARGITRANARRLGASALSNPLVKVNEDGAIQIYLHVSSLGEAEKATLETYEAAIEIANEELGIIQAWIPFDRIDEIAQLSFVKRITPPNYAIPRAGSVITGPKSGCIDTVTVESARDP